MIPSGCHGLRFYLDRYAYGGFQVGIVLDMLALQKLGILASQVLASIVYQATPRDPLLAYGTYQPHDRS